MRFPRLPLVSSLAVLSVVVMAPGPAPAASGLTVVMSGLDNPRGLAMDTHGTLYVAEAGKGGAGQPGPPVCAPTGRPAPEDVACAGRTGAVSRLRRGVQQRIVTGLPSAAPQALGGEGATGPHDVSLHGSGGIYVTLGLGGGPAYRAALGEDFGWLIKVNEEKHTWRKIADVATYEFDANPGGGAQDSNPYGLLARAGGRVLTDAGGNSLLRVWDNGAISTLATFPSRAQGRPTDAVPTSVARGPDGAYYVGELSGVPFNTGAARVYRVVPGQAPEVFCGGFTTIIDLTFGPDGRLYVLQHSSSGPFFAGLGSLVRVASDCAQTTILGGLMRPTSVLVTGGRHGDDDDDDWDGDDEGDRSVRASGKKAPLAFYISNRGTSPGVGEVIRFEP